MTPFRFGIITTRTARPGGGDPSLARFVRMHMYYIHYNMYIWVYGPKTPCIENAYRYDIIL